MRPGAVPTKAAARFRKRAHSARSPGRDAKLHPVPPSPEVMSILFMDYLKYGKPNGVSFRQYLAIIGFTDPAAQNEFMDDGRILHLDAQGIERIAIPKQPVSGDLAVKVLLVDFADREGKTPPQHYDDMLFSRRTYPTGSMADFFCEVSLGKVELRGSVHGWLRMPENYAFYTNNESGTEWASYPRNAPRLAEDAVRVALANGISFGPELDKLGQGIVTALFVVHAGRGAEELHPAIGSSEIWSHKWRLRSPIDVGNGLYATLYLTVPQDCKVGVCAHELGHLAFQWQDFYDPNYDEDGEEWDGSGRWDLMAGGSYNGNSLSPAHPAALHKLQHGWIDVMDVSSTQRGIFLDPYSAETGHAVRVRSSSYKPGQYLLLENRTRKGFDFHLPGEGLLVWRVDETAEQTSPNHPGLMLVQADGKHDLENPDDWNQGDAGDPFPGSTGRAALSDRGEISTSFAGQADSGVTLSHIEREAASGRILLDIEFA